MLKTEVGTGVRALTQPFAISDTFLSPRIDRSRAT